MAVVKKTRLSEPTVCLHGRPNEYPGRDFDKSDLHPVHRALSMLLFVAVETENGITQAPRQIALASPEERVFFHELAHAGNDRITP